MTDAGSTILARQSPPSPSPPSSPLFTHHPLNPPPIPPDPTQLPKNIQRRGMAMEQARITKAINQNVERVSSARALKAGDTFSMNDVKSIGKELNRDIRREEVTRKKTRVEEKLAELQAKIDA
jgi:hypothetical protein